MAPGLSLGRLEADAPLAHIIVRPYDLSLNFFNQEDFDLTQAIESLRDYFSQFGEVQDCTVMRDGATGRSRGFGFLTFRDTKTVNTVMVKEHFLDGKIVRLSAFTLSPSEQNRLGTLSQTPKETRRSLHNVYKIDPKRAIPRDEQEKTSKIFVGGVSQDATEHDFREFFMQFGRVIDATLMMDKDTGRPRGFGFVTFDSEAAVEKCLDYQPLEILGKAIEVKKAQPRGKIGEEDEGPRGGRARGKFGREDRYANDAGNQSNQGGQNGQAQNGMMGAAASGMTPQMMAQYWQRMQQYFAMMQQQMAAAAMSGGMGAMGMGQMNPQMMQQMQQMQQLQQMQKQMQSQQPGSMSPAPQSPSGQNLQSMGMQGMNPQMQQQMMQQMQMQMQQQQNGMANTGMNGGMGVVPPMGPGMAGANRPAFNAQEQLAFEQQKYEQQQARRAVIDQGGGYQQHRPNGNQNQGPQGGGPTSWEGMYDDVPQPNNPNAGGRGSAGVVRNLTPMNGGAVKAAPKGPASTPQPSAAPANAPTGPKNAGKPGSNYRGGRGGGRFNPYGR